MGMSKERHKLSKMINCKSQILAGLCNEVLKGSNNLFVGNGIHELLFIDTEILTYLQV